MKITFRENPEDPAHPMMHGKTPIAKEFNKRQAKLWATGNNPPVNFEQVSTILMEILMDEYNKNNSAAKKKQKTNGEPTKS